MNKIWFIDENPAQRAWFYSEFKYDFEVLLIPAEAWSTVESLVDLAFSNHVDLLIVDYEMRSVTWFNGDDIEKSVKAANPYFPLLILTSHVSQALDYIEDPNITCSKEIWGGDRPKELEDFKKRLNTMVSRYLDRINVSKERLLLLEEKISDAGLDAEEEDEYVELNCFMDAVLGKWEALHRSFYSMGTNERLDNLIQKAEALLAKF